MVVMYLLARECRPSVAAARLQELMEVHIIILTIHHDFPLSTTCCWRDFLSFFIDLCLFSCSDISLILQAIDRHEPGNPRLYYDVARPCTRLASGKRMYELSLHFSCCPLFALFVCVCAYVRVWWGQLWHLSPAARLCCWSSFHHPALIAFALLTQYSGAHSGLSRSRCQAGISVVGVSDRGRLPLLLARRSRHGAAPLH